MSTHVRSSKFYEMISCLYLIMCCFVHVCVYTLMIIVVQGKPAPEVIKLFFMLYSTEHEISTVHKTKFLKNNDFECLNHSYVIFILLINVNIY